MDVIAKSPSRHWSCQWTTQGALSHPRQLLLLTLWTMMCLANTRAFAPTAVSKRIPQHRPSPLFRLSAAPSAHHGQPNTLAGDYIVQLTSPDEWRIFDIGHHHPMDALVATVDTPVVGTLTATRTENTIRIQSSTDSVIPSELLHVLARCMVQTIPNYEQYTLALLDDPHLITFSTHAALFQMTDSSVELVEFVHPRSTIAIVPRTRVHQHNLLHRGIGVVVVAAAARWQDDNNDGSTKQIYVHQRTAHKRIFPALYDMFCGGISTAGESPFQTTQREVAEELGLVRVDALSEELFVTTICTAYNRCVVHVFQYDFCEHLGDVIRWQPEEVAWGAFCNEHDVRLSADMSIARLMEQQTWPGKIPLHWDDRTHLLSTAVTNNQPWATWDYVPDGLLVWEAWLAQRTLPK